MGPKKIPPVPENFDEVLSYLKNIQSEVTKNSTKLDKFVKHIEVLEGRLVEAEAKVVVAEEKVGAAEAKVVILEAELESIKVNHEALLNRIKSLEENELTRAEEIHFLKINSNLVQQRFRMHSMRVYNMGKEVKNCREAAAYLYEGLFRHAYTDAATGNHPGPYRVIEYCHLLPPMPGKENRYPGYNYIIRFTTRFFKQIFFESKKDVVDKFNKDNGVKIKVAHDYTYINRKCLAALHDDPLVKRVTFRTDKILFKLQEDGPWVTVQDPFGKTAAEMVMPEEPVAA